MKLDPSVIYVETENGFSPLGILDTRSLTVPEPDDDCAYHPITIEATTGTFEMPITAKQRAYLMGLTNNCIKMHGGKPLRTVPKKFRRR